MGNRLTKIYTKTGDDGTTGLGDGTRVDKDDVRVEAFGCVDELNSALGIVLTHEVTPPINTELTVVQHDLFDLGGELCIPGREALSEAHVTRLETRLDEINGALPPLKDFILPGGTMAAAACHLARALCRRAERRVVTLSKVEPVNAVSLRYLNRLSDLLFVMARHLNRAAGVPDVLWQPGRGQG